MRFGIFYEHQLPRPCAPDDEHRLLKDALEQVELADRLGIDYLWEVEHHLLKWEFPPTAPRPRVVGLRATPVSTSGERSRPPRHPAAFRPPDLWAGLPHGGGDLLTFRSSPSQYTISST